MKKLLAGCCVLLVSCGPKTASKFDAPDEPVVVLEPQARQDGQPASGAVTYLATREATAPLMLNQAVTIDAQPDTDVAVPLPVDFSMQGVWAKASLPSGGWLEVDGARQWPSSGGLVFFPLSARTLRLKVERAQQVKLLMVASVDSAGGGLEVLTEPRITAVVPAGDGRIDDAPHTGDADDTMLRLTRVELSSTSDAELLLGRCDTTTPVHAYRLTAGVPLVISELLTPGTLCTQSSAEVTISLEVSGRVRRFSETSLRPVRALTVFDTQTGVGGWLDAPLPGQRLDFDLHGVTGFIAGSKAALRVDGEAPVKLGRCDEALVTHLPGELVFVEPAASLCVESTTQAHVRLTLLAVTAPRSEETGVCQAPPAPPACDDSSMLGRLNCLPGVTATEAQLTPLPAGASQYLLRIKQPVDHFHPDGPTFSQRVLLTVRDESAPMVMVTTGYELFGYFAELTNEFATNQLEIEHRFFADSTPSPVDYSTLTIMQSAWDSHRIVETLRPLFTAKWITTGASKGGMTALYHRRFFPCDVDATAPYVTPLSLGTQDARYGPWLAQLGGAQWENCRLTFEDLEVGLIGRRAELAPNLNGTYSLVGNKENALWELTGSAYWGIFQYGEQADTERGCPAWEPLRGSPDFDDYVTQYAQSGEGYSDETLRSYTLDAYSYQTQNELGSPGGNRAHLAQFGPIPQLPDMGALILGDAPAPEFERRAMPDVQRWLKAHGERFVFVYGGFDPWTGGRVDSDGAQDAFNYVVEGGSHGSELSQLPAAQQDEAFGRLSTWLGVQRVPKRAKASTGAPLPAYRDFMRRHSL